MEFREVLLRRQSCRSYQKTPVEARALGTVLEAGNAAPVGRRLYKNAVFDTNRKSLLRHISAEKGLK